jgi:hypothetical protein
VFAQTSANLLGRKHQIPDVRVPLRSLMKTSRAALDDAFRTWSSPDGWRRLSRSTLGRGRRAAGLSGPAYAIDDETAIKVVDGTAEIVSAGHWKLLTRSAVATESGY